MSTHTQAFTLPENPPEYMPEDTGTWKVPMIMSKHTHVKGANMPNEDQVFRFLDLPAEMRNLVCHLHLHFANIFTSNANCCLGVPRTSRVAQQQTREMLAADSAYVPASE